MCSHGRCRPSTARRNAASTVSASSLSRIVATHGPLRTDVPFVRISQSPAGGRSSRFRVEVQVLREKLAVGNVWGNIFIETDDDRFPEITIPLTAEIR